MHIGQYSHYPEPLLACFLSSLNINFLQPLSKICWIDILRKEQTWGSLRSVQCQAWELWGGYQQPGTLGKPWWEGQWCVAASSLLGLALTPYGWPQLGSMSPTAFGPAGTPACQGPWASPSPELPSVCTMLPKSVCSTVPLSNVSQPQAWLQCTHWLMCTQWCSALDKFQRSEKRTWDIKKKKGDFLFAK